MGVLVIIPVANIINQNCQFTGVKCGEQRRKAVQGCYSSFHYYPTIEQQIASIVMSLIKGHFFIDGNKRISLFTYLLLAELNKLKPIEDEEEQVRLFVDLAASHGSMEEYAARLFPE